MFYEVSANTNLNVLKMFYNVLAELPFFDQFEKAKDKLAIELGNLKILILRGRK